MSAMKTIRLLVVDDSALARRAIASSLTPFREIEIVGMASDPYVARDQILALNPDVVTLDIEMPRMDGLTFLKVIMKHRPMPVIIMSSLTQAGSAKAMEALQSGAVDVMDKPSSYSAYLDGTRLAEKVRAAACARIGPIGDGEAAGHRAAPVPGSRPARSFPPRKIILIGASTGGTEAIKAILTALRGDLPGICIVQHIPAFFSKAFADRLNELCELEVREAKMGDLVAPVHYQRPAVDILFDSAVRAGAAPHAVAALLTGMGTDGAAGLLQLRDAGAVTIAQNEQSCVVFGMPREAIRLGAAQKVLSLPQIAPYLETAIANATAPRPLVAANGRAEGSPRFLKDQIL